jgi:GTP-binding protein
MAQIGERPPRFAIQVNARDRLTRDYAYFVENRLRERYRLEGVPLIIDFVQHRDRRGSSGRTTRGPRDRARPDAEQPDDSAVA